MSVDRTFLSDAEPLVFDDPKTPSAARKVRPMWYKRLRRMSADIGALEDSVAALPDSQETLDHLYSADLPSATLTLDVSIPRQRIINTAAFTLVAPSVDGSCVLLIQNLTAGAVTFSGFNTQAAFRGDTLTTSAGDWFLLRIDRIGGFSFVKITQEAT